MLGAVAKTVYCIEQDIGVLGGVTTKGPIIIPVTACEKLEQGELLEAVLWDFSRTWAAGLVCAHHFVD